MREQRRKGCSCLFLFHLFTSALCCLIDRGNFTPQFYPRRFEMRDVIVDRHPQVLEVLLNTVLHRYGKAGVGYVEFSVSGKYLLNGKYRTFLRNPFSADSFRHIKGDFFLNFVRAACGVLCVLLTY